MRTNLNIYDPPDPDLALVIERHAYKAKGGSISCGHSPFVWDKLKSARGGEIILCNSCGQYLAVILGLPWVSQHRIGYSKRFYAPKTNHCDGKWLHPVDVRVTRD